MIRVVTGVLEKAAITVSIADERLSRAVTAAVADAVRTAANAVPFEDVRVVRLRTRKRLELLGPERLAGSIAIVRVTERNARRLPDLVDAIRAPAYGTAGVQMVWDGTEPPRSRVERDVFTVLERARATPSGPPVVLAKSEEPALALRILVARRARKDGTRS
jgi:hypothetical protein